MTTARSQTQKSRKPAHQNKFAYEHNKKSKRTQYIQSIPITNVCSRCEAKIEWRKKFRKYKPLTVPKKCQLCEQKSVKLAYHIICDPCSTARNECAACRLKDYKDLVAAEDEAADQKLLEEARRTLRERERRQLARLLETQGEEAALVYLRFKMGAGSLPGADDDDDDADDFGSNSDGDSGSDGDADSKDGSGSDSENERDAAGAAAGAAEVTATAQTAGKSQAVAAEAADVSDAAQASDSEDADDIDDEGDVSDSEDA